MQPLIPPTTVYDWRRRVDGLVSGSKKPRDLWDSLEAMFVTKGYTLWTKEPNAIDLEVYPPNFEDRRPDGFSFRTAFDDMIREDQRLLNSFGLVKTIHCPARTSSNRDVLIRLVSVAGDESSQRHMDAIQRLATGEVALRGDNHVLPVLDWIEFEPIVDETVFPKMTFAVFPLMTSSQSVPWFYDYHEVFDYVKQVLQGILFCHNRLVAHLDIDADNILINFAEGPKYDGVHSPREYRVEFRSMFPARYYLIDFELSATFSKDSDAASRTVTGLPTTGIRTDDPDVAKYGRIPAKEMLTGEPYCPFRADMFQVGEMFRRLFKDALPECEPFGKLVEELTSDDPNKRPSALDALERVKAFVPSLSERVLSSWPGRKLKEPEEPLEERAPALQT